DEGFLNDVFGGGPILNAPAHERQEPPFVASDELVPGARIAVANLLHNQTIGFRRHGVSVGTEAEPDPPARHSACSLAGASGLIAFGVFPCWRIGLRACSRSAAGRQVAVATSPPRAGAGTA